MRAAHERRLVAIELAEDMGEPPVDFGITATRAEDPETVAKRVRDRLGITMQQQAQWKTHDHVFRSWRDALEASGVLVTVLGGAHHQVPIEEVRGFAIAERPFPMIVVNGRDGGYGRVFTMLHELAHVVLGEGVFEDDIEPSNDMPAASRATETFCNRLAAAVLMPRESLLAEMVVAPKNSDSIYSDAELSALATRYGVSREAMLVRLAELDRVNQGFVQAKRAELAMLYAAQKKKVDEEDGGGFLPPMKQLVYHVGRGYTRIVLQAYYNRRLTLSAASGYLGAQAKLIPKIERATFGGAALQ
jgi:Zn-dependent peptidase ImmA (M78 family)